MLGLGRRQRICKLSKYIKMITGLNNHFEDLDYASRHEVAQFIQNSSWKNDIFVGRMGYDVLTGKFFFENYDFSSPLDVQFKISTFTEFNAFLKYFKGNIYEDACYFGMTIQPAQIKKCKADIRKMNFDSYIDYDIDSISLDSILSADKSSPYYIPKKAQSWYENLPHDVPSEKRLLEIIHSYFSIGNVFSPLGMLYEKYGDGLAIPLIQCCRANGLAKFGEKGIAFEELAYLFGARYSSELLNLIKELKLSEYLKNKYRRFIKAILSKAAEDRNIDLDRKTGLYRLFGRIIWKNTNIDINFDFFDFECLSKFLKYNLKGLDLSKLPILSSDISKCETDNSTIMPLLSLKLKRKVEKEYNGENFVVTLCWINSSGEEVYRHQLKFSYFCDFAHFLKGDLSKADLVLCDGLERLTDVKSLNLEGAEMTTSSSIALGLSFEPSEVLEESLNRSKDSEENEELPDNMVHEELPPSEKFDYSNEEICVGYISDIHITNKFFDKKCKSIGDKTRVAYETASSLSSSSSYDINLIAGDIAAPFDDFKIFLKALGKYKCKGKTFLVLGNHELLMSKPIVSISQSIEEHRAEAEKNGIYLVENELYYISENGLIQNIPTTKLISLSTEELRGMTRGSKLVIFGGYGSLFGNNDHSNAIQAFHDLYKKVAIAERGRNLVVVTHIPTFDFIEKKDMDPGVVYVHGHDHRQFYFDNGQSRVIADNQVGYGPRKIQFKYFYLNKKSNWFDTYSDGIYEISREDYLTFCQGMSISMDFFQDYQKLYLIKRSGVHLFMMTNQKGELRLLNGGAIRNVPSHPLTYFFDKLEIIQRSISLYFGPYFEKQKKISEWVKSFGGYGTIHGCIIDIDFFNHLYFNPFDGKLIPYHAVSVVDKEVYPSIRSLIAEECPPLLDRFLRSNVINEFYSMTFPAKRNQKSQLVRKSTFVSDTYMYNVSNVVRNFQYANDIKVIRFWDDKLVEKSSKDNGLRLFEKSFSEIGVIKK